MTGSRARAAMGPSLVLAGALAVLGGAAPAHAADTAKKVTWNVDCAWVGASKPAVGSVALAVTLTAPETVAPGANVDVGAKFTDGKVLTLPAGTGVTGMSRFRFAFAVTGGTSVEQFEVPSVSTPDTVPDTGVVTTEGEGSGRLVIPSEGTRSLTPVKITFTFATSTGGVDLVCAPKEPAAVALTVKAQAAATTPAAQTTTPAPGGTKLEQTVQAGVQKTGTTAATTTTTTAATTTTSSSSTGTAGGLANTGTKGSGMAAFAMLAGTALLGALAVLLTTPIRRRKAALRHGG